MEVTRDSGRPSLWGGLSSLCKISSLEMSVAWALPAKDLELSFLQEDSGGKGDLVSGRDGNLPWGEGREERWEEVEVGHFCMRV